jgi:plastocyanin
VKRLFAIGQGSLLLLFLNLLLLHCATGEERIINKPGSDTVRIRQMQFQPAELTVHTGDTVVFVNEDMVAHDVTEASSKDWASGPMATGGSWKMRVTKSDDYYCSIHVVMKGKIMLVK